jgi:hypothetical protein
MKKHSALHDTDVQNALLGDLESIRALLDIPTIPDDGEDVPMLEDMVGGSYSVTEAQLTRTASIGREDGVSALADETIEALLGDEWRERADEILAGVRVSVDDIETHAAMDRALDEQLRRRMARTVDDWLAELVHNRIDALRARMLELLDTEIKRFTK